MTNLDLRITNLLTITSTPTDIDALTHDLDSLLDIAYAANLIPDCIDYFYDDCHAAPFDYLAASLTYLKINNLDADDSNIYMPTDADAAALQFNLRMILETIKSEMIDFAADPERIAEYFTENLEYLTDHLDAK